MSADLRDCKDTWDCLLMEMTRRLKGSLTQEKKKKLLLNLLPKELRILKILEK